jgi:hypothetical protein
MGQAGRGPELGVGMVGYGYIGKVHSFAHRSLPLFFEPLAARTRLVGVCTASEASGKKAVEQAGYEFATRDYQDLLARDDIHLIHCCTPNDVHYPLVMDALRAGKHIYCDKPLARTLPEAEEIAALARQTSVVHRMTFNYRFVPATLRALAELLKALLTKFDNLFGFSLPYIMVMHQAPTDSRDYSHYLFHIEFYPPNRTRDKLKYLAGSEAGAGAFINDTLAEEKAEELRRCEPEGTHP